MIPSPADLTYFLEVARLQNLSRAAESLAISQPSLSLAIQRLEKSVGTSLLTRHKRGVSLTQAGRQLLAHTRQLLQHWDTIKSQTLASVHQIQGCFTIGCHSSVALHSLPRFLGDLLENNPRLEIKLQHDHSRKITEQVIRLQIDIGIVVNPVRHPDLIIKHLDNDRIQLWRGRSERKIQDLHSGEAVLLCDPDMSQTQSILKKLKRDGIAYKRIISTNNLEVIADLTQSGCGIGILPGNVARARNLISIPKAPFYQDEICLLYRGENRDVKAIQAITNAVKAAFKSCQGL
ncbi:LysR family transcriptional regulator [Aquicella lusitana]|uniref:DNA-binding transcriptional LysR family regulator n=1 Tax=Aquicella lusitana TaxID=254246 RepID=A0A370GE55_9COXI|nr:LysR family transcriptional regulator [Aquicella lusitana]RDI41520.1 DNA-binding transcriptional LysR family regulator [Aquicella lusitana]VVC72586.1 HTH-type transcriptional regulator YofA [Aquicella lusitana]